MSWATGTNDRRPRSRPFSVFSGAAKNRLAVALSLMAACLAVFLVSYQYDHPSYMSFGRQIGEAFERSFPLVLAVWFVCYVVFWRPRFPRLGLAAFLALLLAGLAGEMSGLAVRERACRAAEGAVRKEVLFAMVAIVGEEGGVPADARIAGEPVTSGGIGEIEALWRVWANDVLALWHQYGRDLRATGWPAVLDAGRLERDADFSESGAIIARARALAAAQPGKYRALVARFKDAMRPFSEEGRKGGQWAWILAWRAQKSVGTVNRIFMRTAAVIDHTEAAVLFLEKTRGTWEIRDDAVVFRKEEDQAVFDAAMEALRQVVREEEASRLGGMVRLAG